MKTKSNLKLLSVQVYRTLLIFFKQLKTVYLHNENIDDMVKCQIYVYIALISFYMGFPSKKWTYYAMTSCPAEKGDVLECLI